MSINYLQSHLFFDKRLLDKQGRGILRLVITRHGERAMMSLGICIRPDQWDGEVINHPEKRVLNAALQSKKADFDRALMQLQISGALSGKHPKEIIELVRESLDPSIRKAREKLTAKENGIVNYFQSQIEKKTNAGTKGLYAATLKKLQQYCDGKGLDNTTLSFNEINKSWLESFQDFCLRTESQNTVAIHLRNIRAVFNAAIDDEKTTNYPFRKFRIRQEETHDKSFSAKELRSFFTYQCDCRGEREAQDLFKLMFCLIGINIKDMLELTTQEKGRVIYTRLKTHKPYSIKLEPEASEIIKKYKGKSHLLNCLEKVPNFNTFSRRLRKNLCKIGVSHNPGKKNEGKPILPNICTGSARTSWATIAQEELDIPRDVIAAALGHHTIDVTSTYLRTDWKKKVDEANRKVLDWVFYEEKNG